MARWHALLIDAWANVGYKAPVENPQQWVPTWVSSTDQRRLAAYRVFAAYLGNSARDLLRTTEDVERRAHREYGDADLIVARIVAGIVGDTMTISVTGADTEPPDGPVLPDKPEPPGPDADDIDRQAFDAALRVWETRAAGAIADWEHQWATLPFLQERQQWLRDWADRELLEQAVWEAEGDAVGLGDGLYVLSTSTAQGRVKIDIYDPGMYFPVLDEEARRRGYPTKVHIAFETDDDGDGTNDHVRRITYELGPIEGQRGAPDRNGNPGPILVDDAGRMFPRLEGETVGDGGITRTYPWAEGEPSSTTCYLTDTTWALADLAGKPVAEFPDSKAAYAVNDEGLQLRRLDLQIDFLPVIHVPNTPARRDHFGRSSLGRVLQLLDDLADADSDLVQATALAGTPMVAVSGSNTLAKEIVVKPGAAYGLGENGHMDVIDLSASVTSISGVIEALLDRVSVIVQLPGEVLGRVTDTGAESGFAKLLKLGPYDSLIGLLRLVRDPKYMLLLKQQQRLSQSVNWLPPGPTPETHLVFGSFLPSDRSQAVTDVVALLQAHGISRRTALQMLVEVGVEIGDLAEELARIDVDDVQAAVELFAATGDESAVRHRLRIPGDGPAPAAPAPAGAAGATPVPPLPPPAKPAPPA